MPRAEREQRMLDAAEEVFGARGFRGASMDEIAERSGVTKPLVYQYFGSKDEMYEACVERARSRMAGQVEAALADRPPEDALRVFSEILFAHVRDHRDAWWLLYGDLSGPPLQRMRARNADLVASLVRRVLDRAGRTLDDDGVELLAHVLVGAGEQAARWWSGRPDVPYEQVVEQFVAMAGGAIGQAFARAVEGAR